MSAEPPPLLTERTRRALANDRWRSRTSRGIVPCAVPPRHEIIPGEPYWHNNLFDVDVCGSCFQTQRP